MPTITESTSDILANFLDLPSVEAALVIGRDGFVIESSGKNHGPELDELGSSLARTLLRMEEMGRELDTAPMKDMFVEYAGNTILFTALNDAVVVVVASDASELGAVRLEMRQAVPLLKDMH